MADGRDEEARVRNAIDRLCAAGVLHPRETMDKLLRFLAERTLDGTAAALKEYSLGVDLFGKPESYDPREDATVRVQVSKLRHQLEDHYGAAGVDDDVRIELPKRQFALKFAFRDASGMQAPAPAGPRRLARRWAWVAAAAAALAAAFVLGQATARGPAAARVAVPPPLDEFWRPVFGNGRPALVCLGTPLFVRFQGARVIARGLQDFEDAPNDPRMKGIAAVLGSPTMQPSHIYTGVGEAAGAFHLAQLFTGWGEPLDIRRNSALTWDDIQRHNLIFLGSSKYNPQIRQLPSEPNFVVELEGVANRSPRPGEPPKYFRRNGDDTGRPVVEDYAVIARLPGIDARTDVVLLGASSTEGTAAAVEQVSRPEPLRRLLDRVKAGGALPRYFEILVKVQFRSMVAIKTEYENHRVLSTW